MLVYFGTWAMRVFDAYGFRNDPSGRIAQSSLMHISDLGGSRRSMFAGDGTAGKAARVNYNASKVDRRSRRLQHHKSLQREAYVCACVYVFIRQSGLLFARGTIEHSIGAFSWSCFRS